MATIAAVEHFDYRLSTFKVSKILATIDYRNIGETTKNDLEISANQKNPGQKCKNCKNIPFLEVRARCFALGRVRIRQRVLRDALRGSPGGFRV